jgi:hypothetical protein
LVRFYTDVEHQKNLQPSSASIWDVAWAEVKEWMRKSWARRAAIGASKEIESCIYLYRRPLSLVIMRRGNFALVAVQTIILKKDKMQS